MYINERIEGDVYVVRPVGRVDARALPEFTACLKRKTACGAKKILLDFSKTEYLSSSGLRVLLELHGEMTRSGGVVAMCSPSEELLELFGVVRLDRAFKIYGNDFEAFEAMLE